MFLQRKKVIRYNKHFTYKNYARVCNLHFPSSTELKNHCGVHESRSENECCIAGVIECKTKGVGGVLECISAGVEECINLGVEE